MVEQGLDSRRHPLITSYRIDPLYFDLIWVNKFTELFFCSKLTFFACFKDTWSKWMISSNYKVLIEKFSYQIFCHLPSKISCSIFRVKTGSFKDSSHKRDTCGTFLLSTILYKREETFWRDVVVSSIGKNLFQIQMLHLKITKATWNPPISIKLGFFEDHLKREMIIWE